jgi:hypothetical protein
VFAFYAQTTIVRTARSALKMDDEGSLVLFADVIAIETVDSADDNTLINGTDDVALTVVSGANPVGSEEPVHVGNKRGRGLYSCWDYLTEDVNPHLTSQSKCKACNSIFMHHKKSDKVKSHLNNCNSFKRSLGDVQVEDLPSWISVKFSQSKSAKNEKQVTSRAPT